MRLKVALEAPDDDFYQNLSDSFSVSHRSLFLHSPMRQKEAQIDQP